ncbi:hypothetical protein [Angustibacter luteus]|uniref:Uncharacterized protein n=1 Tax=Angustibacter luteus TaxID=658456 RepID=A0ABW1JD92_9ACTN
MTSDALQREWRLLSNTDPAARAALAATDPEAAYQAITRSRMQDLLDDPELPHAGELYCAWAELEDLFEIGRSTPEQFKALVRVAAQSWLARPATQSSEWLERWTRETREAVTSCFKTDGTILDGKPFQ